jgi:hypothetical protein
MNELHETCPCGATFHIKGDRLTVLTAGREFRRTHANHGKRNG